MEKILPEGLMLEERCWYLIKVQLYQGNVLHHALLYSGFLENGIPGGYAKITCGTYEQPFRLAEIHHLEVVRKLTEKSEDGFCLEQELLQDNEADTVQNSQLKQMEAHGCCVCSHHEFVEKTGLPENPYGTTYVCSACGTLHMFGYGKEVLETEIVYLNPADKDRCFGKPVWKCE